jgi:dTMP kinase
LLKISIPVKFNKKLIVDRYIYDIAVNLSLTTNNDIDYAFKIISLFYKFAPKPDVVIYVDIPEEIAFDRKNDIQDIEYLRERRERYLAMVGKYDFKVIDGQRNYDQMLEDTLNVLLKSAAT